MALVDAVERLLQAPNNIENDAVSTPGRKTKHRPLFSIDPMRPSRLGSSIRDTWFQHQTIHSYHMMLSGGRGGWEERAYMPFA